MFEDFVKIGNDLFVTWGNGLQRMISPGQWQDVIVLSSLNKVHRLAVRDGLLFAIGDGIYVSRDSGRTWSDISDNLDACSTYSIAFHNQYLFAFTDQGAWRRPLNDLGVSTQFPSRSSELLTLTPSIVTRSTVIRNVVVGHYSLTITDLVGRRVLEQHGFSDGRVFMSLPPIASGVYLVTVVSADLDRATLAQSATFIKQ